MIRSLVRPCGLALFFVLAGCLAAFVTPAQAKTKEPKIKDIADTVLTDRILTKFAVLLRASDLASFLSSRGPLTFFAPVNSAFSRIPPDTFAALQRPENKEILQRIILFHAINAKRLTAADLKPLKTVVSCEGSPLPLRINRAGYQIVSKAKIIRADTRCMNGLVHEIDTVLLPPGVSLTALASTPPPVVAGGTVPPDASTNSPPETNVAPVTNAAPLTNDSPATNAGPVTDGPLNPTADVPTNAKPLTPAR